MAFRRHLQLGYVARVHGLAGELAAKPFDPESQTLLKVKRVVLRLPSGEERQHALTGARQTPKETLIALADVRDRTAAEELIGATVLVFREDLGPLADNEFFQGDLVGLEAVDPEGRSLGRVEEVFSAGPVPNLVIRTDGGELMVPFADEFVPEVDVHGGRVVVRPPEEAE